MIPYWAEHPYIHVGNMWLFLINALNNTWIWTGICWHFLLYTHFFLFYLFLSIDKWKDQDHHTEDCQLCNNKWPSDEGCLDQNCWSRGLCLLQKGCEAFCREMLQLWEGTLCLSSSVHVVEGKRWKKGIIFVRRSKISYLFYHDLVNGI